MSNQYQPVQTVDARNLACPMPIVKTRKAVDTVEPGQVVEVLATDKGALKDIESWSKSSGHELLHSADEGGTFRFHIRKKAH